MGDEAVVVGVRVRPFNAREKGLGATCCVTMDGATTQIKSDEGKSAKFAFDASFWSHDSFTEDEKGYCHPNPGSNYADQSAVYNQFGKRVLDNAWAGYHTCLFAYGQTGAGKSYSMIGYGVNKGIVPISCEEIFTRIDGNTSPEERFEVLISMVEIYNETVQDLFVPAAHRDGKGLNIRESTALGIYVEGVVKDAVDSYAAIEKCIDHGAGNRQVGSTAMNATSSRSHVVITIEFKHVVIEGGLEQVRVSNINLIDLAGSEKSKDTGATGETLKEGNAINKSLSALGNVISALADQATGKAKPNAIIPYRDSKLTRLLQNALGGSSKTIMICAISPASTNYEETLSTLRYADRAKKIKNVAKVNENPMQKLLRELKEENEKLKTMLATGGSSLGAAPASEEMAQQEAAQLEKVQQLRKAMNECEVGYSERLAESRERERKFSRRMTTCSGAPLLLNLNQDANLAGKLRYLIPEGKTITFTGNADEPADSGDDDSDDESPEGSGSDEEDGDSNQGAAEGEVVPILLMVEKVFSNHASITNVRHQCFLMCPKGHARQFTWVNGVPFSERVQNAEDSQSDGEGPEQAPEHSVRLKHGDRVTLGRGIFVFGDPRKGIVEMLTMTFPYRKARSELPPGWKYRLETESKKSVFCLRAMHDSDSDDDKGSAASSSRSSGDAPDIKELHAKLAAKDKTLASHRRVSEEMYAKLKRKDQQIAQLVAKLADRGAGAACLLASNKKAAQQDGKFRSALASLATLAQLDVDADKVPGAMQKGHLLSMKSTSKIFGKSSSKMFA